MVDMSSAPRAASGLLEMRLTAITYGASGTNFYEFRPLDDGRVPAFTAGAHVDLHLPNGMIRQYSIASAQGDRARYVLGIKRDEKTRGGSAYMHDSLRVGEVLRVGGPRNHFPLVETGAPVVLIAGGIGVTPLYSMLDRARAIGIDWAVHYAVRSREDAALLRELEAIEGGVHLHFDAEAEGRPIDLAGIIGAAPRDAHLYCCGPTPMIDAFEAVARAAGFPDEQIHVERFSADPPPVNTEGFVVELARSGIEIVVQPGQTVLECARAAGLPVEASCEQGICGACETRVLAGIPDHHDVLLSAAERASNTTMMICCSGSLTERLKLDL
jgi:vanillate O-demethylase ferredoxin subunit